jgi:hypothetical protein
MTDGSGHRIIDDILHVAMGEGRCRNEAGMLKYYEARQAARRGTLRKQKRMFLQGL